MPRDLTPEEQRVKQDILSKIQGMSEKDALKFNLLYIAAREENHEHEKAMDLADQGMQTTLTDLEGGVSG